MANHDFRRRTTWAKLVVPSAACAIVLAPAAAAACGPSAAAVVFATCLIQAVSLGLVLERHRRDAGAQLRRPELRGRPGYNAGVYESLLGEVLGRVSEMEAQTVAAKTAKGELEARLHLARRRSRHLAEAGEHPEDGLILADAGGRVLHANAVAARLFKFDAGDSCAAELPGPLLKVAVDLAARPAVDGRTVEFGLDGQATTHRAAVRPVFDEDGQPLGTAIRVIDVRDENAEKQRHAEFVSSVCHELKTPMASIKAYTEMLKDGDAETEDERVELCTFIETQVDRLTRLVNNMLNLARIQSGVIQVRRVDCELNDLLGHAADTVRQLAEEKSIRLTVEPSHLYLAVHVDRDLLSQAAINLLSNAVKYTPNGGEVRLRTRLDGDRAVIEVKDSGMGIPPESLPRLFERFYRVPRNSSAAAGTGLGLALVKYITSDLHNGSIAVQSEVDKGSTFTVSLPFGHRDRLTPRGAAASKSGSPT